MRGTKTFCACAHLAQTRLAWSRHAAQVNGRLAAQEHEEPETADKEWPHLIWPTAAQCPRCRKSAALSGKNGDIPDWDLPQVYDFLVAYYSGSGGGAAAEQGLRGLLKRRTKHASWVEAGVVCGAVAGVVFMVLRGSQQYKLRKSESRVL